MAKPINIRLKPVEEKLLDKLAAEYEVTKTDVIHAAIFAMAKKSFDEQTLNQIVLSNYHQK